MPAKRIRGPHGPEYAARNREYMRKRRQNPAYRAAQAEYGRGYRATWSAARHMWAHLASRLSVHHLTLDQYHAFWERQNERCAICKDVLPCQNRSNCSDVAIDHDHTQHSVRGLLCGFCNRGIGNFRDDPERLQAAAAYVRRHRAS